MIEQIATLRANFPHMFFVGADDSYGFVTITASHLNGKHLTMQIQSDLPAAAVRQDFFDRWTSHPTGPVGLSLDHHMRSAARSK